MRVLYQPLREIILGVVQKRPGGCLPGSGAAVQWPATGFGSAEKPMKEIFRHPAGIEVIDSLTQRR